MTRRRIAGAAASLLLALILLGQSWAELPRRVRSLAAFAPKELAVRRLGGSGTAFDRRYFSFLENVRRSLPPETAGIDLYNTRADPAHLYLAAYWLAPRLVGGELDPHAGSGKSLVAAYGVFPPEGAGDVLVRLPEGALLKPWPGSPIRVEKP